MIGWKAVQCSVVKPQWAVLKMARNAFGNVSFIASLQISLWGFTEVTSVVSLLLRPSYFMSRTSYIYVHALATRRVLWKELVIWRACRMRLIFWLYEVRTRCRVGNKIQGQNSRQCGSWRILLILLDCVGGNYNRSSVLTVMRKFNWTNEQFRGKSVFSWPYFLPAEWQDEACPTLRHR